MIVIFTTSIALSSTRNYPGDSRDPTRILYMAFLGPPQVICNSFARNVPGCCSAHSTIILQFEMYSGNFIREFFKKSVRIPSRNSTGVFNKISIKRNLSFVFRRYKFLRNFQCCQPNILKISKEMFSFFLFAIRRLPYTRTTTQIVYN